MGSIGNVRHESGSFTYTREELAEALERWQSDEFTEMRAIDDIESGDWESWKNDPSGYYDDEEVARLERNNKILNDFLKNSPKYEGEVERGLFFESKKDLNKFLRENKVGDTVTSKSMSSWSSLKGEGASYAGDQALDVKTVTGYSAVVVMHQSTSQGVAIEKSGQREQILPKGIRTKVIKVTKGTYTNFGQSIPRIDIYYQEIKKRRK